MTDDEMIMLATAAAASPIKTVVDTVCSRIPPYEYSPMGYVCRAIERWARAKAKWDYVKWEATGSPDKASAAGDLADSEAELIRLVTP